MAKPTQKPSMSSILDSLMDYRTFFDLANVMMVIIDNKYKVVLVNSKACKILGCPLKGIEGKNWFDNFLPPGEVKKVKHVFNQIMKGKTDPFSRFENHIVNRQGEKRLINWHNTYLKDNKGRICFTLSSGVDITDYEQAKSDLKKSEEKYKKLFEESNDAILVIDKKSRIIDANHAATRVSGHKKSALMKMGVSDLIPKEDKEMVRKKLEEGFKKGFVHFPCRGVRKNGRLMYVDVNTKVIDKKKGLMLGIIRDLTRQKTKESKEIKKLLKEIRSLKKVNQVDHKRIRQMEKKLSRLEPHPQSSKKHKRSFKRR